MVLRPVTVMHAVHIPIWIIGVTVHVMMDMLVLIVEHTIPTYRKVQLAITHVQVAVMDLKCMTV
jgi:hypothetical protein